MTDFTPEEITAMAEKMAICFSADSFEFTNDGLLEFTTLVADKAAAQERERMAAQLVSIGDGYGIRDRGLDATTYSRMQETAYEHAAVILTNGVQWSALSAEELAAIRARGQKGGV